jgi:hypothetical protein
MRLFLLLAFVLMFPAASSTASRCYTLLEDPGMTASSCGRPLRSQIQLPNGETADGHQLTREESDKECLSLDPLGEQLQFHGYC